MGKNISEQEVRHVARLSRLKLDDQQVHHFTDQLEAILQYISKLNELDVEGIEPMAHPLDLTNVMRDDQEQPGISTAQALANAPEAAAPFFKVPKILGDGGGA